MKRSLLTIKKIIQLWTFIYVLDSCSMLPHIPRNLKEDEKTETGLDVIYKSNFDILKGMRIGLITNQTGLNKDLIQMSDYAVPFEKLRNTDVSSVGGKNASLGEMISQLQAKGVRVPTGFATTAHAFKEFLLHNNLGEKIELNFSSTSETEIHVHGYDIHFIVQPNKENILEIELFNLNRSIP